MKATAIISLLCTCSAYCFTYNLGFNFGFDPSFNGVTGYLVADATSDNSADITNLSNIGSNTSIFTEGDYVGNSNEFQVISGGFSSIDVGGGNFLMFGATALYDSSGWDANINSGDTLGVIWTDGLLVWAFSGLNTADSLNGGTIGWVVPNDGSADSLVELSTTVGGRLDLANDIITVGAVGGNAVPEPTSSALLALGGLALVTRRKR